MAIEETFRVSWGQPIGSRDFERLCQENERLKARVVELTVTARELHSLAMHATETDILEIRPILTRLTELRFVIDREG